MGGENIDGESRGIDGSGGKSSKDWRLRRCGWAIVHLGSSGLFDSILMGTLPTEKQSSPRTELYALTMLVKNNTGHCRVYCDYLRVVKGVRRPLCHKGISSMLDLRVVSTT